MALSKKQITDLIENNFKGMLVRFLCRPDARSDYYSWGWHWSSSCSPASNTIIKIYPLNIFNEERSLYNRKEVIIRVDLNESEEFLLEMVKKILMEKNPHFPYNEIEKYEESNIEWL